MKKLSALLCAVLLLLCCSGCGKTLVAPSALDDSSHPITTTTTAPSISTGADTSTDFFDTLKVAYKSGKNFEILTDENNFHFHYKVWDDKKKLLDEGYTDFHSPDIYEKNGLLTLYRNYGSIFYAERYYDVANSRVSPFFSRPVAASDKLIAYFEDKGERGIALVIQDIFDSSVYYEEIQRDFSDLVLKDNGYKGKFLNNNTKLKITYPLRGKEDAPITEEISLI